MNKSTSRFVVFNPSHITLVLEGACLTNIVANSNSISKRLSLKNVFLSDKEPSQYNKKDTRVLHLSKIVREVERQGNYENEEYDKLLKCHKRRKR